MKEMTTIKTSDPIIQTVHITLIIYYKQKLQEN